MTTTRFVDVNGTRLYYEAAGAGPAVVLLHGFTLDTRMWDDQFLPLAQRFRVIHMEALEQVTQTLLELLEMSRM